MYISRFELRNYKSFYEPKPIELLPGFNIITGQNNAGKTALLTTLSLNFSGNPHCSERTVATPGAAVNSMSWVDVTITAVPAEVLMVLQRPTEQTWSIAPPSPQDQLAQSVRWSNGGPQEVQRLLEHIFSRATLNFQFRYQANQSQLGGWGVVQIPTFGLYPAAGQQNNRGFAFFQVKPDLSFGRAEGVRSVPTLPSLVFR